MIPVLFKNEDFTCEVAGMLQFIAMNYDSATAGKALAVLQEIERQLTDLVFEVEGIGIENKVNVWIDISNGSHYDTLKILFDYFDGCEINKRKVEFDDVAKRIREHLEVFAF